MILVSDRKPPVKKVLSCLISNRCSEGERDAFKFLQRFVRGMDMQKASTFFAIYNCRHGMIVVGKKIEVVFF